LEEVKMKLIKKTLAPEFALQDETGVAVKLSDYRGKNVVLYFYPKDDTPGCTTEACSFRDGIGEYKRRGVVVLGVSPDSVKSHAKFKKKYGLPFKCVTFTVSGGGRSSWVKNMMASSEPHSWWVRTG
jgi:peroxiredoxin